MKKISFSKMVASGNDFVVVEDRRRAVSGLKSAVQNPRLTARKICDRKFGVGADGLLIVRRQSGSEVGMRIFNADGSEAEMCGNGARCAALFSGLKKGRLRTRAGVVDFIVNGPKVKVRLTDPFGLKLDMPVRINNRLLKVNFINTGVPHTVVFAGGLDKIDVLHLGRQLRYHQAFAPAGTNVDFIEPSAEGHFNIRTYERGVEGETLACGTGSVASALILALKTNDSRSKSARTAGGEVLKVYFKRKGDIFSDVWLQGGARVVFKGYARV